ncbi:MAG: glutamate synthase subunit beta [Allobaculum sp.]|nr:glutamate synthase subunit beta [Allobaculum sp.]
MDKNFGFLQYERQDDPIVEPKERLESFQEFHRPLNVKQRRQQAARCMHCGVPFCQSALELKGMTTGCPLHNLIPEWNEELFLENDQYALWRLLKTNPFPEFTSRVCPALCEKACINGIDSKPTTIHDNEFYIIENGFQKGWVKPAEILERTSKKIAVIGSGPSGLSAADSLNKRGHTVDVYEREDHPGGLLMYGIPNMKLDKSVVDRRLSLMEEEGVHFITNTEVGQDISLEDLDAQYDAIILATGSTKPRALGEVDPSLDGVYYAVDFLKQTTKDLRANQPWSINAKDKHVIIVGGGDTGNDCTGTVLRQNCKSVTALEMMPKPPVDRLPSNPWPEWPKVLKVDYGQSEAMERFHEDPRRFSTTIQEVFCEEGRIIGVQTVELGPNFQPIEGSEQVLPCDLLLIAAGFVGVEDNLKEAFDLPTTPRNTIVCEAGGYRIHDNLFACGDCKKGQSLVVWALNQGRECAREVDEHLMGYSNIE